MAARRVQEWLTFHQVSPGDIDGSFGTLTGHAVEQFQKSQNLQPTGVIDATTWSVLTAPLQRADSFAVQGVGVRDAVVATAQAHLAQAPIELGGDNRGPWVRYYCHGHDGTDWAWCQGFASSVFQQAFDNLGVQAPFPTTITDHGQPVWCLYVPTFVDSASQLHGVISGSDPALRQQIHPGAFMFVRGSNQVPYQHVGLVETVDLAKGTFSSIEGNTDPKGSSNGYEVARRVRTFGPAYDFGVYHP